MSQIPPPYPQHPPPSPYPDPAAYGGPTQGAPPPGAHFPHAPGSLPAAAAVRPKARWFWIGGGIMVLGIIVAIGLGVLGILGISDTVDDFARVSPGTDTVRIDSAGEYVIYAEDGSFSATVEVLSPDAEPVRTSRYSSGLSYEFGGRSGQAVSTFEADGTGRYTVTTDTRIAIGPSIAGDLVQAILIPFVIAGIGLFVGLIIIVVTAVRRSGSKKRAALAH